MPLTNTIAGIWNRFQGELFPNLAEDLGPVTETKISWQWREEHIAADARLDGGYVVRTNLVSATISSYATVEAYTSLDTVERTFRNTKSDLNNRPIYVDKADRVRAYVFLCMLARYLKWHRRQALAPMLFQGDDPEGAKSTRKTPVEPAQPSTTAKRKASTKHGVDGLPVHSFRTLLADLSTLVLNEMRVNDKPEGVIPIVTEPSALQQHASRLLKIKPSQYVPITQTG